MSECKTLNALVASDPLTRLTVLRTLLSTPHGVNEDHIANGGLVERRTENVHAFVRPSMSDEIQVIILI